MKRGKDYSFGPALEKLTLAEAKQVKAEIMEALEITTAMEWYNRKKRWRNIPQWAYSVITAIFVSHGLQEAEIWHIQEIED